MNPKKRLRACLLLVACWGMLSMPTLLQAQENPPAGNAIRASDGSSGEQGELPPVPSPTELLPELHAVQLQTAPLRQRSLSQIMQQRTTDAEGGMVPLRQPNRLARDKTISVDLPAVGGIEHPYCVPVDPFCYRPLYFEEPELERYGCTSNCVCQPVLSGLKFYSTVPALPFLMLSQPPHTPIRPVWPDVVDQAREYGR